MVNHNRKSVTGQDNSRKVIDLSGKAHRKPTKLALHQAFSSLFYRNAKGPEGDLYREVQAAYVVYLTGDLDMAARFQPFLNKKNEPGHGLAKKLIFQQAYMQECLRNASPEVLGEVTNHINARYIVEVAKAKSPWLPGKVEAKEADLSPEVVEANRLAYYQKFVSVLLITILLSNVLTGTSTSYPVA